MEVCKLEPVVACAAYELAELVANIKVSVKRPYPRLHMLPEFGKPKGDLPIALAAGGPSIRQHLYELKQFRTIMAVGSAHDFLTLNGVSPTYSLLIDAHSTVTASYIQDPQPETNYLVATQCPESVFAALQGYPITMWHCIMKEAHVMNEIEPGWQGLGGGCTSGLRAIGMAMTLGYSNIHLFGYDSCLGEELESHAYPLQSEEDEAEGLGTDAIHGVRFGMDGPGQKLYRCYGYHLAQAQGFEQIVVLHHDKFRLTFHGDGLLSAVYDMLMANPEKMEAFRNQTMEQQTS